MDGMRVLLVDDEKIIADTLFERFPWERANTHTIDVAYNVPQAQKLIMEHKYDIVISDIEMPIESGLDLLVWTKQSNLGMEFIFLTSHADFQYAQSAIQLECSDYLLKPVDYEEMLQAIEKCRDRIKKKINVTKYENNIHVLQGMVWKELLTKETILEIQFYKNKLRNAEVIVNDSALFTVAVLDVKKKELVNDSWENSLLSFSILNVGTEMFLELSSYSIIFEAENNRFVAIYFQDYAMPEDFKKVCEKLVAYCNDCFACTLVGSIRTNVSFDELIKAYKALAEINDNNVMAKAIIYEEKEIRKERIYPMNSSGFTWSTLLEQGKYNELRTLLLNEMNEAVSKNQMNRMTLDYYLDNIHKMLCSYIANTKNSKNLLNEEMVLQLQDAASKSIVDASEYITYVCGRLIEENQVGDKSIIEKAKEYIEMHMDEELFRDEIAEHVHVSSDYLTRLFKKEENISLHKYIVDRRIQLSKELLVSTNLSIGDIAMRIGYGNSAAFTAVFRKATAMTPSYYRKIYFREQNTI